MLQMPAIIITISSRSCMRERGTSYFRILKHFIKWIVCSMKIRLCAMDYVSCTSEDDI